MPKVLTTLNQKGGVGKTMWSFHLAHAALGMGKRVLVVDFDTQRDCTITLAGELPEGESAASHLLFTAPLSAKLEPLVTDSGIHLLFATKNLGALDSNYNLRDALKRRDRVRNLPYDVIVIDTPPALSLRLLAPLVWADLACVPVQPNEYSVRGLAETLDAIRQAQRINPALQPELFINLHDQRKGSYRRMVEHLMLTTPLFNGPILTNRIALSNAVSDRIPVWKHRSADTATKNLWKDYCERLVA